VYIADALAAAWGNEDAAADARRVLIKLLGPLQERRRTLAEQFGKGRDKVL